MANLAQFVKIVHLNHSVALIEPDWPAGSTTQNKAVITNNSTTIGLFTTDTSDTIVHI